MSFDEEATQYGDAMTDYRKKPEPLKQLAEFERGVKASSSRPVVLAAHGGRIIIRLPLPNPKVNQNHSKLKVQASRVSKEMRNEACRVGLMARLAGELWRQIREARAEVTFYVPDNRRRDPNNLAGMCKAYWDGLVDSGLLYDDDRFCASPMPLKVDANDPRCEVTIWEVTPEQGA